MKIRRHVSHLAISALLLLSGCVSSDANRAARVDSLFVALEAARANAPCRYLPGQEDSNSGPDCIREWPEGWVRYSADFLGNLTGRARVDVIFSPEGQAALKGFDNRLVTISNDLARLRRMIGRT